MKKFIRGRLRDVIFENIELPIKVGDTVLMGRFKNKKVVVKDIEWDKEKANLKINGKPALKFRIPKKDNIKESLLTERVMDVDDDVEFIYNEYFKEDIDKIRATGTLTGLEFMEYELDTSKLTTPLSKKAHKLNPCKIIINTKTNFYSPTKNLISIAINTAAINFVLNNGGSLKRSYRVLKRDSPRQTKIFINEFNPSRIKGSIHHELAHWIDDTLHNNHITDRAINSMEHGTNMTKKGLPINADKMEIQGQIHNIYQLKKEFYDVWDDITFKELIGLSTTLTLVNKQLTGGVKVKWKRDLMTRMGREGLLGKNMVRDNKNI